LLLGRFLLRRGQGVPIIMLTLAYLLLSGALWYVRPNPHVWLFGSLALWIGWGYVFLRLITKHNGGIQR
ncbi:MAG: hypothetical protein WBC72_19365, partial [Pseudolabrys sp.]